MEPQEHTCDHIANIAEVGHIKGTRKGNLH